MTMLLLFYFLSSKTLQVWTQSWIEHHLRKSLLKLYRLKLVIYFRSSWNQAYSSFVLFKEVSWIWPAWRKVFLKDQFLLLLKKGMLVIWVHVVKIWMLPVNRLVMHLKELSLQNTMTSKHFRFSSCSFKSYFFLASWFTLIIRVSSSYFSLSILTRWDYSTILCLIYNLLSHRSCFSFSSSSALFSASLS